MRLTMLTDNRKQLMGWGVRASDTGQITLLGSRASSIFWRLCQDAFAIVCVFSQEKTSHTEPQIDEP